LFISARTNVEYQGFLNRNEENNNQLFIFLNAIITVNSHFHMMKFVMLLQ